MPNHLFFIFLFLVILLVPTFHAYGDSVSTANLLPVGQTAVANDEIILDNISTLDLTLNVIQVDKITKTIGAHSDTHISAHSDAHSDGHSDAHSDAHKTADISDHNNAHNNANSDAHSDATSNATSNAHNNAHNNAKILSVALTQQIQFVSNISGNPIILLNTEEPDILVKIPDGTRVSAPNNWDKTISPPKIVTTTGIAPSGFATPTSAIQIGSPDVVLVFDSPVTIILDGVTGQMGYKLSGTTEWVFVDHCLGTFDSTTDPIFPNECYITDGTDTKILTFHFTEFTTLTASVTETTTTTTSTGGSGKTGVGPGSSGTSSGQQTISDGVVPMWISNVVVWWNDEKITDQEFKNVITYLLDKKIIPSNALKSDTALAELKPSVKQLFVMWSNGNLSDSFMIKTIDYHRSNGTW